MVPPYQVSVRKMRAALDACVHSYQHVPLWPFLYPSPLHRKFGMQSVIHVSNIVPLLARNWQGWPFTFSQKHFLSFAQTINFSQRQFSQPLNNTNSIGLLLWLLSESALISRDCSPLTPECHWTDQCPVGGWPSCAFPLPPGSPRSWPVSLCLACKGRFCVCPGYIFIPAPCRVWPTVGAQ